MQRLLSIDCLRGLAALGVVLHHACLHHPAGFAAGHPLTILEEVLNLLAPTIRQTTRPDLTTESGNLNLLLGSVGLKVNPVGNLLLVGNVLFSIGTGGLQDKVTPVFGIDYTF